MNSYIVTAGHFPYGAAIEKMEVYCLADSTFLLIPPYIRESDHFRHHSSPTPVFYTWPSSWLVSGDNVLPYLFS